MHEDVPLIARMSSATRTWAGSLPRQFALAVAVVVAPVLVALVVIGLLMVISGHDALLIALIVLGAGALAIVAARLIAGGILRDVETIRFSVERIEACDCFARFCQDRCVGHGGLPGG